MKKTLAFITAVLFALALLPALIVGEDATAARTELLDLTAVTEAVSSEAEGWAFDPVGNDGSPKLTLSSYGSEDAHSAPVIVPADTTVEVHGECYIDNAVTGADQDVLSGSPDGYLRIEGDGTLNLYAQQHKGRCIALPMGGENVNEEFLYINGLTVNCFGMERTNNNASTLPPCIYGNHAIEIKNAVVNTSMGSCGISMQGFTPIGGVNEENTNELLIENSTVDIQNESANNLWNYAKGLNVTFGRVRIVNSDVNINAGSNSVYAYLSFVIESGSVNILSTPASTAASAALVYCDYLSVGAGVESLYFSTTKFPLTKVINCKKSGQSVLADGLEVEIGLFENGDFQTAPDENNNDLPALKITGSGLPPVVYHTVNFYGFGGTLIGSVQVEHGEAAAAPQIEAVVDNESGTYRFYGWDAAFDEVLDDIDVHAEYLLLGDVNLDGTVTATDALLALRGSMDIVELSERQLFAADVEASEGVNATDALKILRYTMGLVDSLA